MGKEEMGGGVIFVDDDRWQFCQNVGMHLGYFWCLSELNSLTDECTQNCAGVGVKMDSIRKTSLESTKKEKKEDATLSSVMDSFQSQFKRSQINSLKHLEVNLVRDELSQLHIQLLLKKTEKYEGNKWVLHTQNHYRDAYKEWRSEKLSSPDDLEFISILQESLDGAKNKKEEAVGNLQEIEDSITDTLERISFLQKEFDMLKKRMYINDDESSDEGGDENLPRSARKKSKKISTQQEIDNEVAEVFVDNDTSADITTEDVNFCMDSQIIFD